MKNLFFLCLLFLFSCDSSNINEAFTTSKEKEKYSLPSQASTKSL